MTHALPEVAIRQTNPDRSIANPWLFFRRWMENPLRMGSIVPSSPALCRRVVAQTVRGPDEAMLELGAGTGVISRALLAAGLPPERLFVVEIVPAMAAHLRRVLPGANVIEGDARAVDVGWVEVAGPRRFEVIEQDERANTRGGGYSKRRDRRRKSASIA
ncbi:MAG: hypothetical protein J0H91_05580 [Rhodospirillales bacterium]|nr:hypothetical protein [Rhodospirillales bacterium]